MTQLIVVDDDTVAAGDEALATVPPSEADGDTIATVSRQVSIGRCSAPDVQESPAAESECAAARRRSHALVIDAAPRIAHIAFPSEA